VSTLRDLSLILLALEGAVFTLTLLAVLAAVNYLLFRSRWWRILPRWFAVARTYFHLGQQIVARVCRMLLAPIFALRAAQAAVTAGARHLRQQALKKEQVLWPRKY